MIQYRQFLRKKNSSKSHLPQKVKTTFVDFSVLRNHVEENMLILRELNTSTKLPKHRGEPAMKHPESTNNIESQNMMTPRVQNRQNVQSVGNVLQIVKDFKEMYGEAQGFPYRFSGGGTCPPPMGGHMGGTEAQWGDSCVLRDIFKNRTK